MTELKKSLIRVMKERRKDLKLSQAALAERVGVSSGYIGEIEIGRKFPTDEVLEGIAKGLELRPYRLFMAERDLSEVAETAGRASLYAAAGEFRARVDRDIEELFGSRLPADPPPPGEGA